MITRCPMSNTLPPGWIGNNSHHHTNIAGLRLVVRQWERRWNWSVVAIGPRLNATLIDSPNSGRVTAAQARADGLAAVDAFARKLLEETAKLRVAEI